MKKNIKTIEDIISTDFGKEINNALNFVQEVIRNLDKDETDSNKTESMATSINDVKIDETSTSTVPPKYKETTITASNPDVTIQSKFLVKDDGSVTCCSQKVECPYARCHEDSWNTKGISEEMLKDKECESSIKNNVSVEGQNSVKDEPSCVVKFKPTIPTNNFSVAVYDDMVEPLDDISFFSDYNIIQFDYSPNTNIVSMVIEDVNLPHVQPLEQRLEDMMDGEFVISVDLFDENANLCRTFMFENVWLERYVTLEPFTLGKENHANLKYKVIFSYENKQIL